jgi:hypothetical protein
MHVVLAMSWPDVADDCIGAVALCFIAWLWWRGEK